MLINRALRVHAQYGLQQGHRPPSPPRLPRYVEVRWDKIERDIMGVVDPKGKGVKAAQDEVQVLAVKTVQVLTTNTGISASSFGGGFLLGLRQG